MAAAAEEALAGTSALPQIGSPTKKTLRIELDGDSAPERTAGDTDRMRNKRGSIGVTKLNESKAKRAAAAQAHQQQACHFSCFKFPLAPPCPLNPASYTRVSLPERLPFHHRSC